MISEKARSFTIIVIISLKCFSFSAAKVCDHIPPSSGSANSANNIKRLSSSVLSFSGKTLKLLSSWRNSTPLLIPV